MGFTTHQFNRALEHLKAIGGQPPKEERQKFGSKC